MGWTPPQTVPALMRHTDGCAKSSPGIEEAAKMKITQLGIDIPKFVYHVSGVNVTRTVVREANYRRDKWLGAIGKDRIFVCAMLIYRLL
jgi:hypothetical protein